MLRILILALLTVFNLRVVSAGNDSSSLPVYEALTPEQIKAQHDAASHTLDSAEALVQDKKFVKKLDRERKLVTSEKKLTPGIKAESFSQSTLKPNLNVNALLGQAQQSVAEKMPKNDRPLVLVSLSMPDSELKALLADLKKIESGMVIRGLYENDFQKTVERFRELTLDAEYQAGAGIDPTLFDRFDVTKVPTFILPLEPIQQCTPAGCPLPKYVKATGSVTLSYFLDLVIRTAESEIEKSAARRWLEMLEK